MTKKKNNNFVVVVLTLEAHASGVWITHLVDRIEKCGYDVHLVTLESTFNAQLADPISHLFNITNLKHQMKGSSNPRLTVVNRISDAAPSFKAAIALLEASTVIYDNCQVWNGATAFSLCANKWCHGAVFQRANMCTPPTLKLDGTRVPKDVPFEGPYLLKPNAGGFGAGIVRYEKLPDVFPETSDGMAILQQYIEHKTIYRVWFLRGKVQCAVVRHKSSGGNEFQGVCLASSCSRNQSAAPALLAYAVPEEVRCEIEDQLLPLMPLAHCGSVEYVVDSNQTRWYIDLNLLSTLPLVEVIPNAAIVWGTDYDPWMELAQAILDYAGTNLQGQD